MSNIYDFAIILVIVFVRLSANPTTGHFRHRCYY